MTVSLKGKTTVDLLGEVMPRIESHVTGALGGSPGVGAEPLKQLDPSVRQIARDVLTNSPTGTVSSKEVIGAIESRLTRFFDKSVSEGDFVNNKSMLAVVRDFGDSLAKLAEAAEELASKAGEAPKKAVINGFGGLKIDLSMNNLVPLKAGQSTLSQQPTKTTNEKGYTSRGYIEVEATPTATGCRVKVDSHHKEDGDEVTYLLQARVRDGAEERLITLSFLEDKSVINPKGPRATRLYDVDYAEVNAYLKKFGLELEPGAPMAVSAIWAPANSSSIPHQWGGFNRGGFFDAPMPNATAGAGAASGVAGAKATAEEPLDYKIAVSEALITANPLLFDKNSFMFTRMEFEPKLKPGKSVKNPEETMTKLAERMYKLGENPVEVQKILGAQWKVTALSEFVLKDEKGEWKRQANGLPVMDPMIDVYIDTPENKLTSMECVARIRSNHKGTVFNVKGAPHWKDGIASRVELGLRLKDSFDPTNKEHMAALKKFLASDSSLYNPWVDLRRVVGHVAPDRLEEAWRLEGERHKFKLEDGTGVEIERSVDFGDVTSLRDPTKNARIYQLEDELDHLQFNNSTKAQGAAAQLTSNGMFLDGDMQEDWLKHRSQQATLLGQPRRHQLEQSSDESFRSTTSYLELQTAYTALNKAVLDGEDFDRAGQKAYEGAVEMGLVKARSS